MQFEIDVMLDYQLAEPADVLLQIEVAQMPDQRLIGDTLTVSSPEPLRPVAGGDAIGQRTWLRADGVLHIRYSAIVEVTRRRPPLLTLEAAPARLLPAEAVPYLMPSRYIGSEQFEPFVESRFGGLEGGAKAAAMLDWIAAEMAYVPGASHGATCAADSFVERQGVCRDYAHLLIGFARAAGIPARMVSAYAPNVAPQDFHAVVELWLSDGWHLVDPTGMADPDEIVRIGVGRDATDIAFMTILGSAEMKAQRVDVVRLP
ncbi:transglutaminase-like domain-containing protein [Sphingomonas colocasiae]|uniref:Transglutaminase family protein n=1 Tax=Sphingomonas colocasiae TaxID=1848973 RepID=A0ABS7PTT2_9SPHN|nr:transglutaminase family protein [Sphingomonas colocasiae]MBY8824581.1 transglutaminase family protein [Sphingomonas colocasiae]